MDCRIMSNSSKTKRCKLTNWPTKFEVQTQTHAQNFVDLRCMSNQKHWACYSLRVIAVPQYFIAYLAVERDRTHWIETHIAHLIDLFRTGFIQSRLALVHPGTVRSMQAIVGCYSRCYLNVVYMSEFSLSRNLPLGVETNKEFMQRPTHRRMQRMQRD